MVSSPQPTKKLKNGIPPLPGRLKWNSPNYYTTDAVIGIDKIYRIIRLLYSNTYLRLCQYTGVGTRCFQTGVIIWIV
jgi:hypothetical protein